MRARERDIARAAAIAADVGREVAARRCGVSYSALCRAMQGVTYGGKYAAKQTADPAPVDPYKVHATLPDGLVVTVSHRSIWLAVVAEYHRGNRSMEFGE